MAIYRLEAKIIGRRAKDKAGKPIPGRSVSVVAKAAYRAGERSCTTSKRDKTYNYRSRAQQVVYSGIVSPPTNAPSWLEPHYGDTATTRRSSTQQRERLWNAIERAREARVDSQLAREFIICAAASSLNSEQQA